MNDLPEPVRVFIGYDGREDAAYRVCVQSILDHATIPVTITALNQDALRFSGLYRRTGKEGADWRDGKPFSTEFSFSRFLVPALMQHEGWALFVDLDFLFRADIAGLFGLCDDRYPLMCVHHKYVPKEDTKMDGVPQTRYDRKNWSSLVLWNCSHEAHENLTVDDVNIRPGWYLHGFRWLGNYRIGKIPEEWNWLEGWSPSDIDPKAVHMTRGGPWFEEYRNVAYAEEWLDVWGRIDGGQL